MFCGLIRGQVISIINFGSRFSKRRGHIGDLGISVLKAYWNMGVGSAMMDILINHVKSLKIFTKMNLEVKANNTNAIKLYEKFGFIPEGRITRALKINEEYYDTLIMGLCID
jgi:RimJ/RimL family protein N-acetyltransferase